MTEEESNFEQSKPFERKKLISDEDFKNLRLNDEELAQIDELGRIFHCGQRGKTIKKCVALVHGFVTQSQPIRQFFEWLSEERRIRPGIK